MCLFLKSVKTKHLMGCMSTLLCPFHLLKETNDSLLSKYGIILLFKNTLLRDYNYDYS